MKPSFSVTALGTGWPEDWESTRNICLEADNIVYVLQKYYADFPAIALMKEVCYNHLTKQTRILHLKRAAQFHQENAHDDFTEYSFTG